MMWSGYVEWSCGSWSCGSWLCEVVMWSSYVGLVIFFELLCWTAFVGVIMLEWLCWSGYVGVVMLDGYVVLIMFSELL